MIDCRTFRDRVHFRADLLGPEREEWEHHAAECALCATLLTEVECIDDAVSTWRAPAPSSDFSARIEAQLADEGPELECEEFLARLIDGDEGELEAWLEEPFETHRRRCSGCRGQLEEASAARATWRAWRTPRPRGLTDRVLHQLQSQEPQPAPVTQPPATPTRWQRLLLGEVRIPRLAAALFFAAFTATLAQLNLFPETAPAGIPLAQQSIPDREPAMAATPTMVNFRPGSFEGSDAFLTDPMQAPHDLLDLDMDDR